MTDYRMGGKPKRNPNARNLVIGPKSVKTKAGTTLAITDAMWDRLEDLHQARLNKERGRRAPILDAGMNALYRRGLAVGRKIPEYDGWIWSCSPEGKALVMDGKRHAPDPG